MGSVWVPPKVSAEMMAERQRFNAEMQEQAVVNRLVGEMERFNYELRQIDERLELVFIPSHADPGATGCRPGYFHVVRRNDNAPWSIMVVEGDNGEPVEPTSRLFEKLRESDLWNPNVMRRVREKERRAEEAAEREKIREREARQGEIQERWDAVTRTQVSMNRDTPWTQNQSANARRAAGDKKKKG